MSDPDDATQWQAEDVASRGCRHDPGFLAQIAKTPPADQIDVARFDVIAILRYARLSSGEPIVSGAETAQLVIESLGR